MGLGALRTSLEIEHPNVMARTQAIFLISGTMMVLAEVDVNMELFKLTQYRCRG
jgi:hypothetical protein